MHKDIPQPDLHNDFKKNVFELKDDGKTLTPGHFQEFYLELEMDFSLYESHGCLETKLLSLHFARKTIFLKDNFVDNKIVLKLLEGHLESSLKQETSKIAS